MVKTLTKRDKKLTGEIEKLYIDKIEELQRQGKGNIEIRNQLYSMYESNKKLNGTVKIS